ncbi:MAG: hypothetical protein ACRDSH_18220 [Pseudonocardiaceae bacterium]
MSRLQQPQYLARARCWALVLSGLVAEFDAEWDSVWETAKASKDLGGVHALR